MNGKQKKNSCQFCSILFSTFVLVFTIQAIEDFNLTLVSKDFQEDSFDTLNVTLSKDNTSQQLEFLKSGTGFLKKK